MFKYIKLASVLLVMVALPVLITHASGLDVTANASATNLGGTAIGTYQGTAFTQASVTIISTMFVVATRSDGGFDFALRKNTCFIPQGTGSCFVGGFFNAAPGATYTAVDVQCNVNTIDATGGSGSAIDNANV